MPTMEERKKMILEGHTHKTAKILSRETCMSIPQLYAVCGQLGVLPLKTKEYNLNFFLEHHEDMSATQIASILQISRRHVTERYEKELGVKCKPEVLGEEEEYHQNQHQRKATQKEKKEKAENSNLPKYTARAILGSFRFNESIHYHHPEPDPIEEVREKLKKDLKKGFRK